MSLRNKISMVLLQLAVKTSKVEHKAGIKTDGCFRTYRGVKFSLTSPKTSMVDIEDIARGLAYKPHFSGFSPRFFSIAEHCLMVEDMMAHYSPMDYEARLMALLHDASEAYTGDVIKPLKNLLPNFVVMEKRIQNVIYLKYCIMPTDQRKRDIKVFDNKTQDIEAGAFYGMREGWEENIRYLSPDSAYTDFLNKFHYLQFKIKEVQNG